MKIAEATAELSTAVRLKVGSVIVKNNSIISYGYNGTPTGWDNNCEYREYLNYGHSFGENAADYFDQTDENGKMYRLKTRPEVLHAESNAISKLARSSESGDGADMFITHAPCLDCAKLIYQSGIRRVYFSTPYRDEAGIQFLKNCNIVVEQVTE